jgi:putative sigma-54 modulation protein
MNLHVTFKNCHSTDALRERAEQKLQKSMKYLREPVEAHMVVQVEKHRHRADITVTAAGEILKAEVETDDMYATIDTLMDKIEGVARRHKERRSKHQGDAADEVDGFGLNETT